MSDYTPHIDDIVTVTLPDEITRARVVRLVSGTAAIVELLNFTTGNKSHSYRKGDLVPCQYGKGKMGLNGWTAISESDLEKAKRPEEVPEERPVIVEMTHADIFGIPERKGKKGSSHAAASGK